MRTRYLLLAVVITGVGAAWLAGDARARALDARLAALRSRQAELAALRAERDRLRSVQPSTQTLAALQSATEEHDRLQREIEARRSAPELEPFAPGEPVPCRSWQNRGRATPEAVIETALWAAAGGDVTAFEAALEFDDATRARAAELLARLPASVRATYRTPEQLVATLSAQKVPLGEAQIAWHRQIDDDQALIALLLTPPETSSASTGSEPPARTGAMLRVRRTAAGWRLVVPAAAIDRLAAELAAKNTAEPF